MLQFLEAFQLTQMFEVFVEERENPQKAQTVMEGELLNHTYNMLLTNLALFRNVQEEISWNEGTQQGHWIVCVSVCECVCVCVCVCV